MSRPTTPTALKQIARTLLESLCNTRDFTAARSVIHPEVKVTHDSYPPARGPDEFLGRWEMALKYMPDFKMEILDMVAEVDETKGAGGKAWVNSRITGGRGGEERESMDLMTIDEHGQVVESRDVQRITKAAADVR